METINITVEWENQNMSYNSYLTGNECIRMTKIHINLIRIIADKIHQNYQVRDKHQPKKINWNVVNQKINDCDKNMR